MEDFVIQIIFSILKSQISSYLKLIYGLSGNDFRVATLSKSNLTYTGIKIPKLTISVISCGRTDGPKLKKNISFENAGFFMILRISLEACFYLGRNTEYETRKYEKVEFE